MSIVSPPHTMTLEQWDRYCEDHEDAYELIGGIPTVAPSETGTNINAAVRLLLTLLPKVTSDYRVLPDYGVYLGSRDGSPTVRQPDLVVVARTVDIRTHRVDAGHVALAVEVVSPSSIERDWITKRAEYARAGIPAYLVIGAGDSPADEPRLTLFDRLGTNSRGEAAYADPSGDGSSVTIRLGEHHVTVDAADLVD